MNTDSYDKSKWITIKDALQLTGYHNAHFRMNILKKGKVEWIEEKIPGTNIPRILVSRASLAKFMKTARSVREDGRGKYTLYATPEEFAAVQKALETARLKTPVEKANKPKAKEA